MSVIQLCDFCGGETAQPVASLTIKDGSRRKASMSFFGFEQEEAGTVMEMCAGCLGHLLPITARVCAERMAKRRKPRPAAASLNTNFQSMVEQFVGAPAVVPSKKRGKR
jgi:hypothetical protein